MANDDEELDREDALDFMREAVRSAGGDQAILNSWRESYGQAFLVFDGIEDGLFYEDGISDLGLEHLNDFYHDQSEEREYDDEEEVEVTA